MASTAAATGSYNGDNEGRNKIQRALSELSSANGIDEVQHVYTLKACFQTQQDAESTQDAVTALLAKLQVTSEDEDGATNVQHVHAVTAAALGALSTILSTAQAKLLPTSLVHQLYALSASPASSSTPSGCDSSGFKNDVHALAKLKILELALSKSALMPEKKTLETLVTSTVREACFFRYKTSSQANYASSTRHANDAAPTTRIAVPSQTSALQGPMGAFRVDTAQLNTAREARQPRRQQSSASLSSRRRRATSSASESERSDTSSRSTRIRGGAAGDDAFAIRTEGLRCLCAFAKLDSKALHPHWPLYIPPSSSGISLFALASSDISLAVRMAALQALRALLASSSGYMALAREAPLFLKATSFTPLSKTIAEMVESINVHTIRLLELYLAMRKVKEMLVATLQLAQVVVLNSPYERLASLHLSNVLGSVLPYVAGLDGAVVMKETSALLTLVKRKMTPSEPKNLPWLKATQKAVRAILDQLQDMATAHDKDTRTICEAKWALLAELLHLLSIHSASDGDRHAGIFEAVQQLVQADISHRPETVAEMQIDVLGACLNLADRADTASDWIPDTLNKLLDHARKSPLREAVRVKIAALSVEHLEHCDATTIETGASLVIELAESPDKAIRLRVYRLLGLLLTSKSFSKSNSDNLPQGSKLALSFRTLLNSMASEPSTAARAEAAWNLANLMESTFGDKHNNGCTNIDVEVARTAMAAVKCEAASRDAEMLRISGVRILGQVVPGYPSLPADIRQLAIGCLVDALQSSSAKMRWNVATAMKAILAAGPAEPAIIDALLVELQTSDNIKVRTCALSALAGCDKLSKTVLETVLQDVEDRKPSLAFGELGRAEALQQSLREAIAGKS